MNIGASIKGLRIKHGMTQHELAEQLGVSAQTISRWETSVTYPDVVMLPILARYFHVTVDHLLNIGGNRMKTITSDRLLIREWQEDDAADLLDIKQASAHFMDYLKFNTVNDSLDTIKIWREYQEMYPVILKETEKVIGVVGLVDIGRYKGYKELEVHICDARNDVGLVTEAHKLILSYGFAEMGLLVAFAYCDQSDAILQQAMLNTGFIYEGTLRRFSRNMRDSLRYSILKEDYAF